ncbi:MAG: ABC transporter permease subunit [Thermaerobacter sp.]|nr:ABC transporter permease subunit [Thermaerobacter sp.]
MNRRGLTLHRAALGLAGVTGLVYAAMLASLLRDGWPLLSWRFLLGLPRELEAGGGVAPEILNTFSMVMMAMAVIAPLGLAVAVQRVEYGRDVWWTRELDRWSRVFLSVPGIVVGLVAYRVLVAELGWPVSILTGTVALAVLNWPFVAVSAGDALAGVPESLREGSLALGTTRWQTWLFAVLPEALPSLVNGLGLAAARMIGESAALIFTAGVNVSPHWGLAAPGETLAVHLWYIRTEGLMPDATGQAAATGIVLLGLVIALLWASQRLALWLERRH